MQVTNSCDTLVACVLCYSPTLMAIVRQAANETLPLIVLPPPIPAGIANTKSVINGFLYCNGPTVRSVLRCG